MVSFAICVFPSWRGIVLFFGKVSLGSKRFLKRAGQDVPYFRATIRYFSDSALPPFPVVSRGDGVIFLSKRVLRLFFGEVGGVSFEATRSELGDFLRS